LVLSRQLEEEIAIAHPEGKITVRVLGFPQRGRVLLGIVAPDGVVVIRGELGEPEVRR
jgi:sRNA-binding carbon storage regulator CsrA